MNEELTQVNQGNEEINQKSLTKEEIENAINSLSMVEIDELLDEVIEEMK